MNNALTDTDVIACKICGNLFYTKNPTICPQCKTPIE